MNIAGMMREANATFVDGSIIGGPAWKPNSTWLYLSGAPAAAAAACFSSGPLETSVIGDDVGKASALKMCYAAYSKGTTALLCAVLAASAKYQVLDELKGQWTRDEKDFADGSVQRVRRVTAKAWRFAGEMDEIAATFEAAEIPGGFHLAAAEVYRRLAEFKDSATPPSLAEVLSALMTSSRSL
jgi:3-hydroxyisobutyrate dehydrogenase-like beta-hydroxyacid dehydrogenase